MGGELTAKRRRHSLRPFGVQSLTVDLLMQSREIEGARHIQERHTLAIGLCLAWPTLELSSSTRLADVDKVLE